MFPLRLKATPVDRAVAGFVRRKATRKIEATGKAITQLASEQALYGAALAAWVLSRFGDERQRRQGNHILAVIAASAIIQRAVKDVISQERPDRAVPGRKRRKGIPRSGRAYDAFPSGHAMNLGVLAPAMCEIWPRHRALIWTACLGLAGTRVLILAHWLSDVLAGLALGYGLEFAMRPITGTIEDSSRNHHEPYEKD